MAATKIAIIGTGAVGATTAYACLMRNITSEIILVDVDANRCKGELLDLSDALSFSTTARMKQGIYKQAAKADIIIITAGKAQLPNQTRDELLIANKAIIKTIAQELTPINPKAIIIMVSNPVDVMTYYAQKLIKLPSEQIIGSGTMLDSQRLRNLIAHTINIAEESIHAYIIGQHGDMQVAALSSACIAGTPLTELISMKALQKLAQLTKEKAYDIIALKKCTSYGVASCVAALCENILFDTNRIMPVSCYLKQYKICMSMPAVIGASGIKQIISPLLDKQETLLLQKSVKNLQKMVCELQ